MNILIICQYYYPEQFQINEIAPELVKRGHDVTVLTGLPNYPSGIVDLQYRAFKKRHETIDGVKIMRSYEVGRKKGKINLIINYLSFAISASIKALLMRENFDVVLSYQLSPITMVYPAIAYKRAHQHCRLLLYCLDIWPESAQAHVKNDKSRLYKYISHVSKRIYGKCDRILVTSTPFIRYLHTINAVPEDLLDYLPQHANDEYLNLDLSSPDNGYADFMYAGNLGNGQVVDTILLAASELKAMDTFRVHIVGDGSCSAKLKELAQELGIKDKVLFYGNHARAEMPDIYRNADALIITLRGNNFVGNTLPGKLPVYMTTGKPIFGAINGAAQALIHESGCGACVEAGDYKGLAQLMKRYMDDGSQYAGCGENAKAYFKTHFTKEIFINKLEKELMDLC